MHYASRSIQGYSEVPSIRRGELQLEAQSRFSPSVAQPGAAMSRGLASYKKSRNVLQYGKTFAFTTLTLHTFSAYHNMEVGSSVQVLGPVCPGRQLIVSSDVKLVNGETTYTAERSLFATQKLLAREQL